jgi:octaprenyl-diphosphate synthase
MPETHDKPAAFASVFSRLAPHMAALDVFLKGQVALFEPEIRAMADYCLESSGKRIRPSLVFLSGWSEGEKTPFADLVQAAAVVEMVHLATLVHDDIMDGAAVRRNRPTAARKYGAEASVLLGDALFSQALHLSAGFPTTEVCRAVSDAMRKVCAGEITQTLRRGTAGISRADYFRIIDLKTAELFHLSCFLGARLGGLPWAFATAAGQFGRQLGAAYQIYDDLADFFGDEAKIGKTLGTDLLSGKWTLPLFALLDKLPPDGRAALSEEWEGKRAPELEKRISQMRELGVFETVLAELEACLSAAGAALEPVAERAPTPLLLGLADVLRGQVETLRKNQAA